MKPEEVLGLIFVLKSMKVGEEKTIDGQRVRRAGKYKFDFIDVGRKPSVEGKA